MQQSSNMARNAVIGIAVLVIPIIVFMVGVGFLEQDNNATADINLAGESARDAVSNGLGVVLPQNVGDLRYLQPTNPDAPTRIKMQLPPIEADALLQNAPNLCFTFPLPEDYNPLQSQPLEWWQPQNAQTIVGGECGSNPYYRVLVDQTDSALWTIYLEIDLE